MVPAFSQHGIVMPSLLFRIFFREIIKQLREGCLHVLWQLVQLSGFSSTYNTCYVKAQYHIYIFFSGEIVIGNMWLAFPFVF